jgi:hypothetical protein
VNTLEYKNFEKATKDLINSISCNIIKIDIDSNKISKSCNIVINEETKVKISL